MNDRSPSSRAIVAGAGFGTGAAVVRRLARDGAKVACIDIAQERASAIADEVAGVSLVADLRDRSAAFAAVEAAVDALGGLETLVDVVGLLQPAPIESVEEDHWRAAFDLNVNHAVWLGQASMPHLRASGRGAMVFIASISGDYAARRQGPYAAAKAALQSMSRAFAIEGAPDVRSNTVSPGAVATPRLLGAQPEEASRQMTASIPMGRMASPEEVAHAVAFLVSLEAGYITGIDLRIDGGATAKFPIDTGA